MNVAAFPRETEQPESKITTKKLNNHKDREDYHNETQNYTKDTLINHNNS